MGIVRKRVVRAEVFVGPDASRIARQASRFVLESLEARRLFDAAEMPILPTEPPGEGECGIFVDVPQVIEITSSSTYLVSQTNSVGGTLGTFKGTLDLSKYSVNVEWGDGEIGPAEIVKQTDGTFAIVGTHDYADAGQYLVIMEIVADDGTEEGWFNYDYKTAIVGAAPLNSLIDPSFYAEVGDDDSMVIGSLLDLNKSDLSDYVVTIDWGDGTTSAGAVQESWDGQTLDVVGGHAYAAPGDFALTFTVTKRGDPAASLSATGSSSIYDAWVWEDVPGDGWIDDGWIGSELIDPIIFATGDVVDVVSEAGPPVLDGKLVLAPAADLPTDVKADTPIDTLMGIPGQHASFSSPGAFRSVWGQTFKGDDKVDELDDTGATVLE